MPIERREALAKAFDESVREEEEQPIAGQAPAPTAELNAEAPTHEEKTEVPAETVDEIEKKAAEARETAPKEEPVTQPVVDEIKAPVSLKATEKEHWSKVPRPIQEAFSRREREVQQALSTTAQARKFVDEFSKVVQPYMPLIQANNSTPLRSVENLMRTAAGLQTGNTEGRAEIVANIIQQYGIDIQTLDTVLSRRMQAGPGQQAPTNQGPPEWARPIMEFMGQVQQTRQQREQQLAQEAAQAVQSIQDRPYFDELRDSMADLMEVAARRNIPMTIEEAYDRAVLLHPEASKVAAQRTKATTVQEAARTLAGARKAASSVRGAPASGTLNKAPATDRRAQIEQAFEEVGSR